MDKGIKGQRDKRPLDNGPMENLKKYFIAPSHETSRKHILSEKKNLFFDQKQYKKIERSSLLKLDF